MNLVDYINSIFKLRGSECNLILNISDVIDTVIAGGIHLDNVGCDACINALTGSALIAGVAVSRIFTIHGLGKNFRTTCLSGTARATEKVGVGKLIILHLIFENIGYAVLTANVVKITGTPFSVKCSVIRHKTPIPSLCDYVI